MLFWKSTNLVGSGRSQASCVLDQDIDVQNGFIFNLEILYQIFSRSRFTFLDGYIFRILGNLQNDFILNEIISKYTMTKGKSIFVLVKISFSRFVGWKHLDTT